MFVFRKLFVFDPYACAIRAKEEYFKGWKTAGQIPREISRHVYYFIKTEVGSANETVISTKLRPSPIPAGGQKFHFCLNFGAICRQLLRK